MKPIYLTLLSLLFLAACNKQESPPQPTTSNSPSSSNASNPLRPSGSDRGEAPKQSLVEARRSFKTQLVSQVKYGRPAPTPPAGMFRLVHYKSPAGDLAAYITASPKDKKKHPAIVWILGGHDNSIGDDPWRSAKPENDQSADAFWKAGIVTLYPSQRGGNDNPGVREAFYGEVDDVLAAADYLAKQDGVDPHRIYLGGHGTGGTLALLSAASTDRFRAVFAFGPIDDVSAYHHQPPFDATNPREVELRSPIRWLHSIRIPVFAFEGTRGYLDSLQAMADASHNPLLHFEPVRGVDHYAVLAPINALIAEKIVQDDGPTCNIAFTQAELNDRGQR